MSYPLTLALGASLSLSLLGGCAMEPYPPLPDVPESEVVTGETSPAVPGSETDATAEAEAEGVAAPVKLYKGRPGRQLTIHLRSQRFEYTENGRLVRAGEVSSGSREHPTPKGSFRVLSKDENKRSGSYTNYFDQPTPMPYAIQFYGPFYVHEGWLPGHADSHGCVRLHYEDVKFVFGRIRVGDRVAVVD